MARSFIASAARTDLRSSDEGPREYECGAGYLPRFASVESFACLAMRNLSTRFAGIWIVSPVAGLRPRRALRSTMTSLPTPGKVKPLRASLYARPASSSSTVPTCFFVSPVFSESRFSVSDFEIPATSSSCAAFRPSRAAFSHMSEHGGAGLPAQTCERVEYGSYTRTAHYALL